MKRVNPTAQRQNCSTAKLGSSLRKIGLLGTGVAVGLTGWLLAQDPKGGVPSPPTPVTDFAVPNAVLEIPGTGPGDVLTRGPIHEAFAKPVVDDNKEPPIIPKAPPAMIEELPPDEKPIGDNVLWIPGYFAWDEDRLDFIWISGVYRDAPPNHAWVTGYWRSTSGGSQWVSGFWTTADVAIPNQQPQAEVEFLPEPPASLEQGPTIEQPGEEHFWIPGNWRYTNSKYAWQAGYWSRGQAGWVWMPAHYNWTPLGYVYVPGFWDYSLAQRGLVFAPVYFNTAYYANPVVYQPSVLLRPNFLTVHLWSRPRYSHYYFGDYYGNNYLTSGYRPWFTPLVANRAYYDPLFSYYSWQGRRVDRNWNNQIQQRYDYVMTHPDARPPRTYHDQYAMGNQTQLRQFVNNANVVNSGNTVFNLNYSKAERTSGNRAFGNEDDVASLQIQNASMTANLAQVALQQKQIPKAPMQLERVSAANLTRFTNQGKQYREIAAQRQQMDGPHVDGTTVKSDKLTTSGKPGTMTINGSAERTKIGGGKVRLPVVQPVAGVAAHANPAVGVVPGGVGTVGGGADVLIPGGNIPSNNVPGGNLAGGTNPNRGPGSGTSAATKSGKASIGKDVDGTDVPTDRNPNKIGKNVIPGDPTTEGLAPSIGGGFDSGVAPLDILSAGSAGNPAVNNPGNVAGLNGTNANGSTTTNTGTTTDPAGTVGNSPNTTANTVPGQRTPANGAFGQDRGPLVPSGQLAPGQQNPQVFNPKVADPTKAPGTPGASAFNPKVGDPNVSTNTATTDSTNTNPSTDASAGTTGNNPKTTANTVPGQRTPTNGAFGQDRGPLVPPGQLAPGQQNPEVFNPQVADPNKTPGTPGAPAFNPKIGDPNVSTNPSTNSTNTNPSTDGSAGTTGNNPKTTANTVPGQRTPTNGAFGQDRGPLVPPGQLAPGQQNPEVFNPQVADPTKAPGTPGAPAFNPKVGDPNTTTNPNTNGTNSTANNPNSGTTGTNAAGTNGSAAPGTTGSTTGNSTAGTTDTNTTGTNSGTVGNNPNTTANTVPGQRTPANGAFGQDRGPLVPPGQLAPGQQNPEVFNPKVADPTKAPGTPGAPAFNPKVGDPNTTTNPSTGNTNSTTNNPTTNGTNSNNAKSNAAGTKGSAAGANTPAGGGNTPANNAKSGAGKSAAPGTANPAQAKSGVNPANKSGAATTPARTRGPSTGPAIVNGKAVGGNPGNDNPVLRSGASNGPNINPNSPAANGFGNGNLTGKMGANPGNPNGKGAMNGKQPGNQNPGMGAGNKVAPVGPGGGGGGLGMGNGPAGGGGGGAGNGGGGGAGAGGGTGAGGGGGGGGAGK